MIILRNNAMCYNARDMPWLLDRKPVKRQLVTIEP